VKTSLLIVVLFAACAAQAQTHTIRVVPIHLDGNDNPPKGIQFFCTRDYDHQHCPQDAAALQHALAPYSLDPLGAWSFVLVPSYSWKYLVRSLGGSPVSPAFSILDQHITVLESSLFFPSDTNSRNEELLLTYGLIGPALLDLAVTHELGHCICLDTDESRADDYGRGLRDKKPVYCIGSARLVTAEATTHEPSANSYTVLGATPEQEALVRRQILVMQPSTYPLRVLFVPHWKYIDAARAFRPHVPAGYASAMFTHLPSRSVFIDSDRYVSDDSLGYCLAHELGHLAANANSASEGDADKAAHEYRKRLKDPHKPDAH